MTAAQTPKGLKMTDKPTPVEQRDRDRAADYLSAIPGFPAEEAEKFRRGEFDEVEDALPLAFARHRIETLSQQPGTQAEDILERLREVHRRNPAEYDEVCGIIDAVRRLSTPSKGEIEAIREALEVCNQALTTLSDHFIYAYGDDTRHGVIAAVERIANQALKDANPRFRGEMRS